MGGGGGQRMNEIRGENDEKTYLNQMVIQGTFMLIAIILFCFGGLFLLPGILSPLKSMTLIVIQRLSISSLF